MEGRGPDPGHEWGAAPVADGILQGEEPGAPPLGGNPRALGGDDVLGLAQKVAHDLPADGGVGVEEPLDHVHWRDDTGPARGAGAFGAFGVGVGPSLLAGSCGGRLHERPDSVKSREPTRTDPPTEPAARHVAAGSRVRHRFVTALYRRQLQDPYNL